LSFIFWSTLLIYQINTKIRFNLFDLRAYQSFHVPTDKKLKRILLLSFVVIIHLPFLKWATILFLLHLGIISTLYNVPEKSKGIIRFPLRSIPVLKIFLIAYVWASMASFLPSLDANKPMFAYLNLLLFTAHFLFIFAITLPFDIRDFRADGKNNLITFPQLIGVNTAKIIALACFAVFTVILLSLAGTWYVVVFGVITAFLIIKSSVNRPDYYFTFYLDGTIILYFIALFLSLK